MRRRACMAAAGCRRRSACMRDGCDGRGEVVLRGCSGWVYGGMQEEEEDEWQNGFCRTCVPVHTRAAAWAWAGMSKVH